MIGWADLQAEQAREKVKRCVTLSVKAIAILTISTLVGWGFYLLLDRALTISLGG